MLDITLDSRRASRSHAEAVADSALSQLEAGELEVAEGTARSAVKIEGHSVRALLVLGRILTETPRGAEEAVAVLKRLVKYDPENPEAYYRLGLAYKVYGRGAITNRYQELAVESFDEAVRLLPSHEDAYYQMGLLLEDPLNRYEEAEQAFVLQVTINPDHIDCLRALVRLLLDMGKWSSAVEWAMKGISWHPDEHQFRLFAAVAIWKLGDDLASMNYLNQYLVRAEPSENAVFLDLSFVLSVEEMDVWNELDDEGRAAYRDWYWRVRDPNPTTEINERLLEHYMRVAWARVEFGAVVQPWDSRGTMFVRYGPPDVRTGTGRAVDWNTLVESDWEYRQRRQRLEEEMGLPYKYVFRPYQPGLESGSGTPPWKFDAENRSPGNQGSASIPQPSPERWAYLDQGIELYFTAPISPLHYVLVGNTQMLADQMRSRRPTFSEHEASILTLDSSHMVVSFRADMRNTRVLYVTGFSSEQPGMLVNTESIRSSVDLDLQLLSPDWRLVSEASTVLPDVATAPRYTNRGETYTTITADVQVPAGDYILLAYLLEQQSGRRFFLRENVSIRDYSGAQLSVSDILPAVAVTQSEQTAAGTLSLGGMDIVPLPDRSVSQGQSFLIYFEIYNLIRDEVGGTDWEVAYSVMETVEEAGLLQRAYQGLRKLIGLFDQIPVVTATVASSGISSSERTSLEVDVRNLDTGTYVLILTVTDKNTQLQASSQLVFRILDRD